MTIFLALTEEFKSFVHVMNVQDFNKKVQSLTRDHPTKETSIRKEFEVRNE